MKTFLYLLPVSLLLAGAASAAVSGEATTYASPNGTSEQCVRLDPPPATNFSRKDIAEELRLCSYDVYREEVAMCPKTYSTSPGTILFSTEGTGLSQAQFEAQQCSRDAQEKNEKLSKFKVSMNQSGTSGTYSLSSLVYYQFSRYFSTLVRVPVAVYRTLDRKTHYDRVSAKVPGDLKGKIGAGWKKLKEAEQNPSSYSPVRDVFTDDQTQIYGVLLGKDPGERYGAEVNGIRSAWGDAQNNDFQETPGFLALRSELPFAQAVAEGTAGAKKNAKLAADLGGLPLPPVQVGLWMRELSEIVLLDYIFNQQDRVGNVDYQWHWVYMDGAEVKTEKEKRDEYKKLPRRKMSQIEPPAEIASFKPVLVQKSSIGDNDAGVRTQYVSFTKRTKMLEKIRHFNAETYRRLLALNADLQARGSLYQHLQGTLGITAAEADAVAKNTATAAATLQEACKAGKLRFDLDLKGIVSGNAAEERVDCERP